MLSDRSFKKSFVIILTLIATIALSGCNQQQSSNQSGYPEETTSTPSAQNEPFDSELGNNAVAAKYAQQFFDVTSTAAPGYVLSMTLELAPEDVQGKNEEEYKNDVTSAFLTVIVDNPLWNSTGEAAQKDLIASLLSALKSSFSGFPHVYVSNGGRTVAEGELSLTGEPKIELK